MRNDQNTYSNTMTPEKVFIKIVYRYVCNAKDCQYNYFRQRLGNNNRKINNIDAVMFTAFLVSCKLAQDP